MITLQTDLVLLVLDSHWEDTLSTLFLQLPEGLCVQLLL